MADLFTWALGRIAECAPESGSERVTSKINDLVAAWIFFDGRSSQLFGMVADPATMAERDSLKVTCETALRGWFHVLRDQDPRAHVELYRALTVRGGFADLAMPEVIRAERELVDERARRLEELGLPSDTLVEYEAILSDVERLRALADDAWFDVLEDMPRIDSLHDVANFETAVTDDWADIASRGLPPDFYPLAEDHGGNYLGLLIDTDLLRAGSAPLVLYFHEHDPVYTWMFESAGVAATALETVTKGAPFSDALRGAATAGVRDALAELNDLVHRRPTTPAREASRRCLDGDALADAADLLVYESAGNRFAARNLRARRLWHAFAERLRKPA